MILYTNESGYEPLSPENELREEITVIQSIFPIYFNE